MSKTIDKITSEQKKLFPVYREKWLEIGLRTETINKEDARFVLQKFLSHFNLNDREIVFVDSPKGLKQNRVFGNNEAGWLSFYDFMKNVMGVNGINDIEYFIELSKRCHWIQDDGKTLTLSDFPNILNLMRIIYYIVKMVQV